MSAGKTSGGNFLVGSYISDVIDLTRIQPHQINLISTGCCTGKTTFVLEDLVGRWPGVTARDVLVVTSRSITASQMDYEHDNVSQYYAGSDIACYWDDEYTGDERVMCMTYDKMIHLVRTSRAETRDVLENVRIIVFDEIHTLFVDNFIHGIGEIRAWLRGVLPTRDDLIVIGMTATPSVVYRVNSNTTNLKITPVIDELMVQHKAKHVICTDFAGAVELLTTNKLPGRNIYMGKKIEECAVLAEVVGDSSVIISKSGTTRGRAYKFNPFRLEYSTEMEYLRDYLSKNRDMPDTCMYKGRRRNLNTLIATSTLREGFSLDEKSGVKNVFVSAVDEMSIIQFLGRCRYDVENLVIVAPVSKFTHTGDYGYFDDADRMFGSYLMFNDHAWFSTFEDVVLGDINSVCFYGDISNITSKSGYERIRDSMVAKVMLDDNDWVFSTDSKHIDFSNSYIVKNVWPVKDIIDIAKKYGLCGGVRYRDYSLHGVMKKLKSLGYDIHIENGPPMKYRIMRPK